MSQTRYCSTCGMLLSEGAAICGECGARYQASPYERRATDAPGAWSQAPRARSRDLGPSEEQPEQSEGIQLISAEELQPRAPGATALRSSDQYDQMMVTQPPPSQHGHAAPSGPPDVHGSPAHAAAGPEAPSAAADAPLEMEPPLDGCAPASPLKRFLAAVIDSVIMSLTMLPLMIGLILIIVQDTATLIAQILVGVGAALPAAYTVLILWLVGSKGFSLGKLILGLRVTRTSQAGGIGILRSLGRWALYGVIPLIMALSIFLDPKKVLRGFHDRAVDSVVVDIKTGRNPMQPRPDDFEREGAEHYLGAPSVPVSAHENLLSEPGAAWRDESLSAQGGAQQPPEAGSVGWGPPQAPPGADPYAPAHSAPADSAPQHPATGSPWSPAPAAPGGGEDWAPPQQSWQPPAPEPGPIADPAPAAPPAQSWQAPAAEAPAPEPQPGPSPQPWPQPAPPQAAPGAPAPPQAEAGPPAPQQQTPAPPAPDQSWAPPSAGSAPGGSMPPPSWAPADPAADPAPSSGPLPEHGPAGGADQPGPPGELTTDAWDDSGLDEDTRMAPPPQADLGDLEQTRLSAAAPRVPTLRLVADDGTERSVQNAVVIGRNPSASDGEVVFVFKDDTRSVSKTHLRIDGTGEDITVTDLGSTNGSAIVREDGTRESLVPNTPTVLPAGSSLTIGDRSLDVERVQ